MSYSMTIGAGLFWQMESEPTYDDIGTYQLLQERVVSVYSGATLTSPLTSSRGYQYSTTGISGGTVLDRYSSNSGPLSAIPEPVTTGLLGLTALLLCRMRRG